MPKLTLRSFAKKLHAFANDIPRQQNEIKKAVVLEVVTQLVAATPKDTGEASSNWMVGIGSPSNAITTNYGPNGDASLLRLAQVLPSIQPGDKVYITNNTRHIGFLNQGWSSQAPAGFVEDAIASGKAIIGRQKLRYGIK